MYGKISLMGRDEITGLICEVVLFGKTYVQVEVPIFYVAYQDVKIKSQNFGEAILKFSGKYKEPVFFSHNAIFCIENIGKKEVLDSRYDEFLSYNSIPNFEDDLPF